MNKPKYLGSLIRWNYVKDAIPKHTEYFPIKGLALDIGAELGIYQELVESKGYSYIGCDVEPKSPSIKKGDAHNLESLNLYSKCDLIICIDVLEHLKDPKKAVDEMKKCLRDGGIIIFHTPNIHQSYILFKHSSHPDHKVEGFTRKELLHLFKDFNVELKKTFNFLEALAWEVNYLVLNSYKLNYFEVNPINIINFDQKNYVPLGWLGICKKK